MLRLVGITKFRILCISLAFASSSFGGSISGGGGDTLPAEPIGSNGIVEIAQKSRAALLLIFRGMDDGNEAMGRRKEILRILFGNERSIYDIIKDASIAVKLDEPCVDPEGKPSDGSYNNQSPNQICISAHRLGMKLDRSNAWPQTIALIAHELTHMVGADESMADMIQGEILSRITGILTPESAASFLHRSYEDIADALADIERLQHLSSDDWNSACILSRAIERHYVNFYRLADIENDGPSSPSPRKSKLYYEFLLKVSGARSASCGMADAPIKTDQDIMNFTNYSVRFKGRDAVTIFEYETANGELPQSWHGQQMPIHDISSWQVLSVEIDEIHDYLSELRDFLREAFEAAVVIIE